MARAATDVEAFAELYRRYVGRVHGYVMRRTGSREIAEDITSATFERALRSLGRFEWRSGGFGPWVFRIASNELTDQYRANARAATARAKKAVDLLHCAADDGAFESVLDGLGTATTDDLRSALDRLNPRYQRALELRYLAGLAHDEAAKAFGASKATFAVVLHRATTALRKAMHTEGRRR